MVFRDKKGRTIRDVQPQEIHVLEDGVEQNLTSFRLVEGNTTKPAAPGTETASLGVDPMREIRLVTLVFEGLDVEEKRFFRQALEDILNMAPEQNLYFSILAVDQKLHVIQPFTADHAALLKSVDRSMMWSFVQYSNQSNEVKQSLKQTLSGDEPQLQSSPTGGASQELHPQSVRRQMAVAPDFVVPRGVYFSLRHSHIVSMAHWQKSTYTREPTRTKAELRQMLPAREVDLLRKALTRIHEHFNEEVASGFI